MHYDIIIVGAGHAGVEAAYAASKMNLSILLLTHKLDTVGDLACNPSVGGVGKGHLVKEIDALGGCIGMFSDVSGINFKILNSGKGAAVQATRIQVDRFHYKMSVFKFLSNIKNLYILQQNVTDIIVKNNKILGVITQDKLHFYSKTVVLTLGTFLNGKIFIGNLSRNGGRIGEASSISLSSSLKEYFSATGRLKTGTPPRVDIRSLSLDYFNVQKSDIPIPFFSYWNLPNKLLKTRNCYISYTNDLTHNIILDSINYSAIYNGSINVVGPRYCPSIEDKIIRFKDKFHHQIFLEPEGLNSYEIYLNGLSTSLPYTVQEKFLKTMNGFNNVIITRPGYAVEYDFFDPRLLKFTLETRSINGLFFAGQINGTTGYEEAAAQGIMAGINAACLVLNKEPLILPRTESYIGVLIDDLIVKGVDEPYRMFTNRSENRLMLREDNADLRLTEYAKKFGLINDYKWKQFINKYEKIKYSNIILNKTLYKKFSLEAYKFNRFFAINVFSNCYINTLFKYQFIDFKQMKCIFNINISYYNIKIIEIKEKYSGYLNKQYNEINKLKKINHIKIPQNINYNNISGLSLEIIEKLNLIRPNTIDQASRIPGLTLSSLLILLVHIKNIYSIY